MSDGSGPGPPPDSRPAESAFYPPLTTHGLPRTCDTTHTPTSQTRAETSATKLAIIIQHGCTWSVGYGPSSR